MPRRNLLILLIFGVAAAVIILLLKPCGAKSTEPPAAKITDSAGQPAAPKNRAPTGTVAEPKAVVEVQPADKTIAAEKITAPAVREVDNAPPVNLTGSEEIPEVARCATANFPAEAKPYVKVAIVTVRLIVDKFGNVRSDTPISVEFPQEVDEDMQPAMRKLFIKAGARAFGAKKCPPHVVNGQNVGYAIEVPLQYKH